jgi:hypothetical protein
MTVREQDLIDAIESTLHFYPPVTGLVDALDVSGVVYASWLARIERS